MMTPSSLPSERAGLVRYRQAGRSMPSSAKSSFPCTSRSMQDKSQPEAGISGPSISASSAARPRMIARASNTWVCTSMGLMSYPRRLWLFRVGGNQQRFVVRIQRGAGIKRVLHVVSPVDFDRPPTKPNWMEAGYAELGLPDTGTRPSRRMPRAARHRDTGTKSPYKGRLRASDFGSLTPAAV